MGVNYYNCDKGIDFLIEINHNFSQLIPYRYVKSKRVLEIDEKAGLIEFINVFGYLLNEYKMMLAIHYNTLDNVRIVRNKYEHKLHDLFFEYSIGDENMPSFFYAIKSGKKEVQINSADLILLLKDLNKLFSKLVCSVKEYAEENGKDDYPIYNRIDRFSFLDFNTIYDSNLLHTIGKLQFDF